MFYNVLELSDSQDCDETEGEIHGYIPMSILGSTDEEERACRTSWRKSRSQRPRTKQRMDLPALFDSEDSLVRHPFSRSTTLEIRSKVWKLMYLVEARYFTEYE